MYEQDLGQIIPDIEATAKVDESTGVPSVTVDVEELVSLDKMIRRFNFMFKNLKGDKPVKGVDYLTEEEKQQFTTETLNLISSEGNKQVKGVTTKGNEQIKKIVAEATKVIEQLKSLVAGNPATTNALTLSGKSRVEFEQDIEKVSNALNEFKNNVGANIKDNSISSSKLKTDSDADKIKLANLAEEVINSMSKLTKDSVVREYIADMAIDKSKLDNSIYTSFYNVDITREWNSIEVSTIEESTELTNETLEFSYISNVSGMDCKIYDKLNIPQNVELVKSMVKVGELTKYIYTSKQPINLKFSKIKIGNFSPSVATIKGLFLNFEVKKNGKTIPVKLKLEEGIIEKQYTGSIVDYELLLKEIYNRKIGLNDFSKEDKLKSIGKTEDKYVSILEKGRSTTYVSNAFGILNKQLKPGKYKISSQNFFYVRILVFEKATGGEVLKTFDLTKDNNEFILENNSFIGILNSNDSTFKTPDDKLWYDSANSLKKRIISICLNQVKCLVLEMLLVKKLTLTTYFIPLLILLNLHLYILFRQKLY